MDDIKKNKRPKREHGTGGVYYVKSKGVWLSKLTVQGRATTKTFKTEKEARKYLKEMIRNQKELPTQSKWSSVPVRIYFTEWAKKYKQNSLAPRSFDGLEYDIEHYVIPHIGSLSLCNITTDDIQNMLNTLADKGRSLSTIKRAYSATRSCLNQAVSNKDIPFNPSLSIIMPSAKSKTTLTKAPIVILSDDEIARYIAVATAVNSKQNMIYRLGWGLVLILSTGMRKEEALALKWEDCDVKENSLYIRRTLVLVKNRDNDAKTKTRQIIQDYTKSKSGTRFIPLNGTSILALNQLRTINGQRDFIFSSSTGTIVSIRNFTRMHYDVMKAANITRSSGHYGIHCLRHTFCSHLIMSGSDVKTISEIMGHADISTTLNIYGHLFKEYKTEVVLDNDFVSNILKKSHNKK